LSMCPLQLGISDASVETSDPGLKGGAWKADGFLMAKCPMVF